MLFADPTTPVIGCAGLIVGDAPCHLYPPFKDTVVVNEYASPGSPVKVVPGDVDIVYPLVVPPGDPELHDPGPFGETVDGVRRWQATPPRTGYRPGWGSSLLFLGYLRRTRSLRRSPVYGPPHCATLTRR